MESPQKNNKMYKQFSLVKLQINITVNYKAESNTLK